MTRTEAAFRDIATADTQADWREHVARQMDGNADPLPKRSRLPDLEPVKTVKTVKSGKSNLPPAFMALVFAAMFAVAFIVVAVVGVVILGWQS
jgi:hypothetical protein